ncbi:hypothetical protein ACHAXA_010109 [Cyclostephanos tholiformis]|uniref:Iron permease FTR1 n=1 Tax=Cyclostephanos tholiformis TaxID=382380 RepID=A0ABD3RXM3_9STRA
MSDLFDGAIMTIFARELLEATVIIGQYRTVLFRSDDWQDPARQKEGLRAITVSALLAALVALIVTVCVAVPLAVLSRELDDRVVEIIEGISKLVAAVCILQLSLKIPKFLGVYASKKGEDGATIGLSLKSIRFNVAWNIWRELAEIGVFLIPFFLGGEAIAVPLSGLAGIAVGGLLGGIIYFANKLLKNKFWLAAFMAILLLMLSTGLFVGGCHEFEEVLGETEKVYNIGVVADPGSEDAEEHEEEEEEEEEEVVVVTYTGWSEKKLPMAIFKPFGYSAGPTQLMTAAFWIWLAFGIILHAWKYISSKKIRDAEESANAEKDGVKTLEHEETSNMDDNDLLKEEVSTDGDNSYNEFLKTVESN